MVISLKDSHTHGSDPSECKAKEVVNQIKQKSESLTPTVAIASEFSVISDDYAVQLSLPKKEKSKLFDLFCCIDFLLLFFDMIHFCECLFEIRVLLNSILTMAIILNQLQLTGTRLRPPPGTVSHFQIDAINDKFLIANSMLLNAFSICVIRLHHSVQKFRMRSILCVLTVFVLSFCRASIMFN